MFKREMPALGLASSILYVAAVAIGGIAWPGYSHLAQPVSELGAVGAPSRLVVTPLFLLYDMLLIGFGIAVTSAGYRTSELRRSGRLLAAMGVVGILAAPFPMHMAGEPRGFTDVIHLVLTGVTVLLMIGAVFEGSGIFGRRFRTYSMFTIVAMALFGLMTAIDAPKVARGGFTPWVGLTERIDIAAFLLWVAILSVGLYRMRHHEQTLEEIAGADEDGPVPVPVHHR